MEDFKTYQKLGLFIGEKESQEQFLKRIELQKKENTLPISIEIPLFDLSLKEIPFFYSNKGLLPWHGAMTWVYETEEGIPYVRIQARKIFQRKKQCWGYSLDELIAHEAIHLARTAFGPSRFEEIFAYMTSPKAYRRFLGPLFRSSKEGVFIAMSSMLFFFPWSYLYLIPICGYVHLFYKLFKDRIILRRALRKISKIYSPSNPWAFALQLTDKEITLFAYKSHRDIHRYVSTQTSLRWKQILDSLTSI